MYLNRLSAFEYTYHWHANFSLSISTIPGGGATCGAVLEAVENVGKKKKKNQNLLKCFLSF